ncbi:GNAT family N-acetyltransferase [Aeromonas bivalvium]|uniref:GNAT family N-acetyltransferase n=1 Tax=Aeromonas bivalvium TaxID=440079 RepID=UPI0005A91990|nr:GNAT family N-acetyltransferase [Aeromonas bivalvium]
MTSLMLKPVSQDPYPAFTLACHRDTWRIGHGSDAGFDERQTRAWLHALARQRPHGLLHLCHHLCPIGQLALAPVMVHQDGSRRGHIHLIYLVPQWRGRGLGCWLLAQALQRIRAAGCTSASLRCLSANLAAERFCLRQGWRKEGLPDAEGQLLITPLPPLPSHHPHLSA